MPFDGSSRTTRVIEILDEMEKLFGQNGEHWTRHSLKRRGLDGEMSYCMLGALGQVLSSNNLHTAFYDVLKSLVDNQPLNLSPLNIVLVSENYISSRNDRSATFDHIRAWLRAARIRALAQANVSV